MKIWLDDQRLAPEGWLRAHSAWRAIELINTFLHDISHISLDFDLAHGDGDGMDVATHLVKLAREKAFDHVITLTCHSANKWGRERIEKSYDEFYRLIDRPDLIRNEQSVTSSEIYSWAYDHINMMVDENRHLEWSSAKKEANHAKITILHQLMRYVENEHRRYYPTWYNGTW